MANKFDKKVVERPGDQYMMRMPPGLRERVAEMAAANGRSMSAEIVAALEQHLKGPDRLSVIESFIGQHRSMIEQMSEYDWFSPKEGIVYLIDRMQEQLRDHDEQINPQRYRHSDD